MNIEIPVFRQDKDQFPCQCGKGQVTQTLLSVCDKCHWTAFAAFREIMEWPIDDIVSWDRCQEKGHKWGEWTDVTQGNESWQERICEVCEHRETRRHRSR